MSTGQPSNFKSTQTTSGPGAFVQATAGYVTSILAIVGLFVLIAIGKLDANVGIPLVAAIVGVHGGAAITNNSTQP